MLEIFKEVDQEKIIKEHIMPLSRNNTTSLHIDNVEYLDDINKSIMIEAGVTKNWTIEG